MLEVRLDILGVEDGLVDIEAGEVAGVVDHQHPGIDRRHRLGQLVESYCRCEFQSLGMGKVAQLPEKTVKVGAGRGCPVAIDLELAVKCEAMGVTHLHDAVKEPWGERVVGLLHAVV